MIPILHKLFQKTEEERILLKLLFGASVTQIPNQKKTLQDKRIIDQLCMSKDAKILEVLSKQMKPHTHTHTR